MKTSLDSIRATLKPGGFFYLDKCHEETEGVKTYDFAEIGDMPAVNPEILKDEEMRVGDMPAVNPEILKEEDMRVGDMPGS